MKRTERSQIQIGHVEFYDTRGESSTRCTTIHCIYKYGTAVNIYQLLVFQELI